MSANSSSAFRLRLRAQPALRLDLAGLTPVALAGATPSDVARKMLWHGNDEVPLGEFFAVEALASDSAELVFEGDLSRCDGVGRGLDGGCIRIEGDVGDYLGAGMSAGEIVVAGSAGMLAACEMAGGRLEIAGDVGDYAASALPGDMDGMRGGLLVVRGNAGARFGDRMRRGTALVFGDAGDFLASRLVAGTIAVAGEVGAHCGYGMRRGTLIFAGPQPEPPPAFVPTGHDVQVIWTLLARNLAAHGGPFAALAATHPRRFVGDLAADGKGEWLLPA
ncbi:formylmethanofuran dehydrogenase subunit C [Azoarcus sp. KH32C]|uniref:formylmethanofuran dehydrogenase subunit C n=1 Tax=Azoarcus sp. KH32C TaxID=748247 RepID=UPI0002385DC4|nr:formylmethanofuran dehydrogenase subunit C [Azoarcus sp. KH32C]BAL27122.1 formylmethanofuran dehydrogenase, subunit C [Azoarcus sp. KH32C]